MEESLVRWGLSYQGLQADGDSFIKSKRRNTCSMMGAMS